LGPKTPAEQTLDQMHEEEMRVRRTTLADGRYFIFYEFLRSAQFDSRSESAKGEPTRSLTETKEAGV
jgi:hypothetical protein